MKWRRGRRSNAVVAEAAAVQVEENQLAMRARFTGDLGAMPVEQVKVREMGGREQRKAGGERGRGCGPGHY